MEDKNNKGGFSGLSDLASNVSDGPDTSKAGTPPPIPKSIRPPPSLPSNQAERRPPRPTQAIETIGRRKRTGGSGWKWPAVSIAIIIVVLLVAISAEQGRKEASPDPVPSTTRTFDNQQARSTLSEEIQNGKMRVKQMEEQIGDMDTRLKNYERSLTLYKDSEMVDEYDALIPSFNALLTKRNDLYEEYGRLIDETNVKVKQYNDGLR